MKKKFLVFTMVSVLVVVSASPVAASNDKSKGSNHKIKSYNEVESNILNIETSGQLEEAKQHNQKSKEMNQKNQIKKEVNQEFKQIREQLKQKNLNGYSEEELNKLNQKIEDMKENYSNIRVLPFENIISRNASFKFDTPPVIKEGRTLVPVRALTEAYGAEVNWDAENKKVTIEKDETTIELNLNEFSAFVNGEEIELDVPAEIMNSRTVVPLRFILEAMGYEVGYDDETDTIEIIEGDDDDTSVRTDSSITTE